MRDTLRTSARRRCLGRPSSERGARPHGGGRQDCELVLRLPAVNDVSLSACGGEVPAPAAAAAAAAVPGPPRSVSQESVGKPYWGSGEGGVSTI